MKANWAHTCIAGGSCCELVCVVGKLDIYYAKAIKCYLVRRDDVSAEKYKSLPALLKAAQEAPDQFPGIEAAIEMGGLLRTTS